MAGSLGEPFEATITILADDWPPFVYLAEGGEYTAAYDAFEQNGQVVIPVRLSSQSGYEARVDYATSGGTATVGEDYQPVSGTLVFEPGRTEHSIVIPIAADPQPDSGETFQIALTNPVECTLDDLLPDDGVVTIHDGASVSFAEAEVSTQEDVVSVVIGVTLSAALTKDAVVSYSTSEGTATRRSSRKRCTENLTVSFW